MNKDTLYEIETQLFKEVDSLKKKHAQYISGIEKGIDMTVEALRRKMNEENQKEGAKE